MKKKKNKERRAEKKAMKQAEKQKKYCSTALEWSDIEMIDGDAIHILSLIHISYRYEGQKEY